MSVLSFSALLNWVITEKSKPHGHCHTRDSKDLLNVVRQEKLAPPRHQPLLCRCCRCRVRCSVAPEQLLDVSFNPASLKLWPPSCPTEFEPSYLCLFTPVCWGHWRPLILPTERDAQATHSRLPLTPTHLSFYAQHDGTAMGSTTQYRSSDKSFHFP